MLQFVHVICRFMTVPYAGLIGRELDDEVPFFLPGGRTNRVKGRGRCLRACIAEKGTFLLSAVNCNGL